MRELDTLHLGTPRVICCHEPEPGVLVDPGPASAIDGLLAALGDVEPRRILLTHIHLDHAGAAGLLVRRFPAAEVWVHGAARRTWSTRRELVASATRLYGDDMDRLWGEIVPVPEANLRVLDGGERRDGYRVAYTPGHASHHVSYLHEASGIALCGDVAGVRIGDGPLIAPTPPPDIDVDGLAPLDRRGRRLAPAAAGADALRLVRRRRRAPRRPPRRARRGRQPRS